MAENLYRKVTKEEQEAAWAESRLYFQLEQNTIKAVAHKQGRAEGAAQEKREIAKNFKKSGIPIEVIARNTGLTVAEIEEL